MLVGNGVRYGGQPMRTMGGAQIGAIETGRWTQAGAMRNFYVGEATVIGGASVANKSAFPNGYLHPTAWVLPIKPGGMAAYTTVTGSGDVTAANLAGGLAGVASVTGSGDITDADLRLYGLLTAAVTGASSVAGELSGTSPMVAALTGTGTVVAAILAAINAAAALAGSGDLTASMVGSLSGSAAITGSGDLTAANLGGIVLATADLAGTGDITDADIHGAWLMIAALTGAGVVTADIEARAYIAAALTGTGTINAGLTGPAGMSADIVSTGEILTSANVGQAVWEYVNRTLTGSGGLSVEQNTRLQELWQIMGLDPDNLLTVTPTRRTVGDTGTPEIDQTIAGDGRTTSTVTRQ